MSGTTSIEWTERTWNPLTGCTKVTAGCDNCYAKTMHERFNGGGSFEQITLHPDRLDQPLRWRKPSRVLVNSMSDLFHKDVPDEYIAQVFAVMAAAPRHTFQILTKRHARMRSLLSSPRFATRVLVAGHRDKWGWPAKVEMPSVFLPLPNVWLGVSVEDQKTAEIRIPALLETPAAVHWLSLEPQLGPVDLSPWMPQDGKHVRWQCSVCRRFYTGAVRDACQGCDRRGYWTGSHVGNSRPGGQPISWVVQGGESGPGARPMHPDWARTVRDQCATAGVPYLFKQWGAWVPAAWNGPDGATHAFSGGNYMKNGQMVEHFMDIGHSPMSSERDAETPAGAQGMRRVAKKAAGRMLDGQIHDGYPTHPRDSRRWPVNTRTLSGTWPLEGAVEILAVAGTATSVRSLRLHFHQMGWITGPYGHTEVAEKGWPYVDMVGTEVVIKWAGIVAFHERRGGTTPIPVQRGVDR